jgi:hypothetical protein
MWSVRVGAGFENQNRPQTTFLAQPDRSRKSACENRSQRLLDNEHSESATRSPEKPPVVVTCGICVLQDLGRTKAVLGGSQSVVSTQNHGSEKAGVGAPSLATMFSAT